MRLHPRALQSIVSEPHLANPPDRNERKMRLLKARSLLQSSDESLAEIASQSGYRTGASPFGL